jgi:polyisoprenoid-binding protein YceI
MMISNVKGQLTGIKGILSLDEANVINSYVEASIEAASISTRDPQRDAHLKSADFFDVEKFPLLSFRSTRVIRGGDGELAVTGNLTIHITRNVVFTVEGPTPPGKDPWGNTRLLGLSATTKINRKDFGLTGNAVLDWRHSRRR